MTARKEKAVFVDRDGTLNEMVYDETHGVMDSPRRPGQVRVVAGAVDFLLGVKELGYLVVVVTNQPGIAKGTLSPEDLEAVNRTLADILARENAAWDDMRFCPHHPRGGEGGRPEFVTDCACRKPKPGLLQAAARDLGLDLGACWMVGDGLNDVEAGRAAGCRTILVTRLKLEQVGRFLDVREREPEFVAADLAAALEIIRGAQPAKGKGGKA